MDPIYLPLTFIGFKTIDWSPCSANFLKIEKKGILVTGQEILSMNSGFPKTFA
jgi:hypothetical protein